MLSKILSLLLLIAATDAQSDELLLWQRLRCSILSSLTADVTNCSTLLCEKNSSEVTCVFAPVIPLDRFRTNINASLPTCYRGSGNWDTDTINGANITASSCKELDCCLTHINSPSDTEYDLSAVSVNMIFINGTEIDPILVGPINNVRIIIVNFDYCLRVSTDSLNVYPNDCLNLKDLCASLSTPTTRATTSQATPVATKTEAMTPQATTALTPTTQATTQEATTIVATTTIAATTEALTPQATTVRTPIKQATTVHISTAETTNAETSTIVVTTSLAATTQVTATTQEATTTMQTMAPQTTTMQTTEVKTTTEKATTSKASASQTTQDETTQEQGQEVTNSDMVVGSGLNTTVEMSTTPQPDPTATQAGNISVTNTVTSSALTLLMQNTNTVTVRQITSGITSMSMVNFVSNLANTTTNETPTTAEIPTKTTVTAESTTSHITTQTTTAPTDKETTTDNVIISTQTEKTTQAATIEKTTTLNKETTMEITTVPTTTETTTLLTTADTTTTPTTADTTTATTSAETTTALTIAETTTAPTTTEDLITETITPITSAEITTAPTTTETTTADKTTALTIAETTTPLITAETTTLSKTTVTSTTLTTAETTTPSKTTETTTAPTTTVSTTALITAETTTAPTTIETTESPTTPETSISSTAKINNETENITIAVIPNNPETITTIGITQSRMMLPVSTAAVATSTVSTMSAVAATQSTTTVSSTASRVPDSDISDVVENEAIGSIRSMLGLVESSEVFVTRDVSTPIEGRFSQAYFSGATVNPSAVESLLQVAVVSSQFDITADVSEFASAEEADGLSTQALPFSGSPALSVTAVDTQSRSIVEAKLSYSIQINATADSGQTVANLARTNNNSGTYAVTRINKVETRCGFFNATQRRFSSNGCTLLPSNTSEEVSCFCNHTTLFAVLLSVQTYEVPSTVKLLSYITESISILCLIITIAILMTVRKKVRSDRTVVQINLSVALLCLHIFNLFQDLAVEDKRACEFVTVTTHFFLLASGTWMLWEGLTLFIKTTDKILSLNKKNPRKVAATKLALGWGIPLLIVVLASAIGFPTNRYMDSDQYSNNYYRCWVGTEYNALLASVIIPMIIIYVVNILIAFKVMWFVHKLRSSARELKPSNGAHRGSNVGAAVRSDAKSVGATLKVFLLLIPVLGVPLLFGFLTSIEPYEASVVFMYINVILNGLQGLFLLLVYCVFGTEVREACSRYVQRVKLRYTSEPPTHNPSKGTPSTHSTNTSSGSGNKTNSLPENQHRI